MGLSIFPENNKNVAIYGHRLDSLSAMIDRLLLQGTTIADAQTKLRERWPNVREDKFLHHVYWFRACHGTVITKGKKEDGQTVWKLKGIKTEAPRDMALDHQNEAG